MEEEKDRDSVSPTLTSACRSSSNISGGSPEDPSCQSLGNQRKSKPETSCNMNQQRPSNLSDEDKECLRLGNKAWKLFLQPAKWTKHKYECSSNKLKFLAPSPELGVGNNTYFEGYIAIGKAYQKNQNLFRALSVVQKADTKSQARVEDKEEMANKVAAIHCNSVDNTVHQGDSLKSDGYREVAKELGSEHYDNVYRNVLTEDSLKSAVSLSPSTECLDKAPTACSTKKRQTGNVSADISSGRYKTRSCTASKRGLLKEAPTAPTPPAAPPQTETAAHPPNKRKISPSLNRVGLLSQDEEEACIPFDHLHLFPKADRSKIHCGYFNFVVFPTEVAVTGDFSGLAFLPTLDTFLNPKAKKQDNGYLFAKSWQVMAVHAHGDFLFLGFGSGEIFCVSMISNDVDIQEYDRISGKNFHGNEVTRLSAFGEKNLVSACLANMEEQKRVVIHWGALKDGNLSRTSKFDVSTQPILSMASTTICGKTLLQFGGAGENIVTTIWKGKNHRQQNEESYSQNVHFGTGKVIFLKYMGNDLSSKKLLVGLSKGGVGIFKHRNPDHSVDSLKELGTPENVLSKYFTGGNLESAELVGDVLILAGGPTGKVYFYSWKDHTVFGSATVHPGISYPRHKNLRSTVMAIYYSKERNSLISMCRDGHVHEMDLTEELKRANKCNDECSGTKKRAQNEGSASIRARSKRRMTLDAEGTSSEGPFQAGQCQDLPSNNRQHHYGEGSSSPENKRLTIASQFAPNYCCQMDPMPARPSLLKGDRREDQQQHIRASAQMAHATETTQTPNDQFEHFFLRDVTGDGSSMSSLFGDSVVDGFLHNDQQEDPCTTDVPPPQQPQHPLTATATTTEPPQALTVEAAQYKTTTAPPMPPVPAPNAIISSSSQPSTKTTGILGQLGAFEEAYYGKRKTGAGVSRMEALELDIVGIVKRGNIRERLRQLGVIVDRIGILEESWFGQQQNGPKLQRMAALQQDVLPEDVLDAMDGSTCLADAIQQLEDLL